MSDKKRCNLSCVRRPPALSLILSASLNLLLVGCSVVYTLRPEKAVEDTLKTLPVPEAAVLLHEFAGFSFGSEDRCIAAYTYRLYGTDLAFDDIVGFYQESLRTRGWQKEESLSHPTWASRTRHFMLAVSSNAEASGAPAESIADGRRSYRTLYYVALTYMVDPICWQT